MIFTDYYKIGQRVRKYRKAYGLSQEQLAEKIGISTTHMSHIETGNTKLSLPVLVALSQALDVQTDALLYEGQCSTKKAALDEIEAILDSCTPQQAVLLAAILKAVKTTLEKQK